MESGPNLQENNNSIESRESDDRCSNRPLSHSISRVISQDVSSDRASPFASSSHSVDAFPKSNMTIAEKPASLYRYEISNPPPKLPDWEKFFPGGYHRDRLIPLRGRSMYKAILAVSAVSVLFYGYDQGVMSGINMNNNYRKFMGLGTISTESNAAAQSLPDSAREGGIVATYYVGTLIGGLSAGVLADRIGRLKTIVFGCIWALVGAASQASALNIAWMCVGRVITGIGTGHLNCVIPIWGAEIAEHSSRGAFLAIEFTLNIAGLATSFWLQYGLAQLGPNAEDGSNWADVYAWRFPLAFQLIFLIVLVVAINFLPESPRWLARVGREDEALSLLAALRANGDPKATHVRKEMYEIMEVVDLERSQSSPTSYSSICFRKDSYHTRRRTWLAFGLQMMQQLVGIGVVTVYAPTIFKQAGYSQDKANILSGCNYISYIFSTLVAVFTLDRLGRRKTLMTGAMLMASWLLLAGVSASYKTHTQFDDTSVNVWGAVSASFIFLYTAAFGATWLVVPWLYPVEIYQLSIRARGGAVSVVGWSIGNGLTTMISPSLFTAITYWTFILFGLLNFACIPLIYLFYPETSGRSLEEMDAVFSTTSYLVYKAKRELADLADNDPVLLAVQKRGGQVQQLEHVRSSVHIA